MKKTLTIQPIFSLIAIIALMGPSIASAQTLDWFTSLATSLGQLVSLLIPILIALAFLVFVWGLIGFIFASGDDDAKTAGKNRMIWGVLALFVITAIWGIIGLLKKITGATDNTKDIPTWPVR